MAGYSPRRKHTNKVDPIERRFREQRKTAGQRGIPWHLPYWEWLQIWQESGHLEERGKHKGEWVMARNGDTGAYEAGNIKIVRAEQNNSLAQTTKRTYRLKQA